MKQLSRLLCAMGVLAGIGFSSVAIGGGDSPLPLPTDSHDFFGAGTQPNQLEQEIVSAEHCIVCHAFCGSDCDTDDPAVTNKPFRWRGSMHAHAGRDPIFHAAVSIANQDANNGGQFCIRCHMPEAFLEGRGAGDRSQLTDEDIDLGISCNVCHRLVDPDYESGVSPVEDLDVLYEIGVIPKTPGNAQMVIDPLDRRRGPYNYGPDEIGRASCRERV